MAVNTGAATELSRETVVGGVADEYEIFAELVAGLTDEQWEAATPCGDASVRHVAAHIAGIAHDVANFSSAGRSFADHVADFGDRTQRPMAAAVRELAQAIGSLLVALDDDAWAGPSPIDGMSMGRAVGLLWHEIYLHSDDIRAGAGLPRVRGLGLRGSLEHVATTLEARGWGPAVLRLEGAPELAVGTGAGRVVSGDAHAFLLAATGRREPSLAGLDPSVNIYA